MRRISKIFFVFLLCTGSCYEVPTKIPLGKWNYKLLVNGLEVGSAVLSNQSDKGNYVSSSEFNIKMGNITTISREMVTETHDFKPIRLESFNKIVSGGNVHKTDIKAVFKDGVVELMAGNKKTTYKINKDFVLDGNHTLAKLIDGKFREGMEVSASIYHPSIELEDTVKVNAKVVGSEEVLINGKSERTIHVSQSIENIKNIDLYYGSDGVVRRVIIQMLNLKIELVKI